MTETPLHWLTISELSQRIRQGALSPVELTEHMLSRLEALDGLDHDVSRLAQRKRSAKHRDTDTDAPAQVLGCAGMPVYDSYAL